MGDSRAYRLGKWCQRLTEDDSSGDNMLCRCVGSFPWQDVQKRQGHLWPGERILLCSDGFWRRLEETELAESLGNRERIWRNLRLSEEQMKKRLRKLGDAARARGEKDNQAAVIVGMEGVAHSKRVYAAEKRRQRRHMQ